MTSRFSVEFLARSLRRRAYRLKSAGYVGGVVQLSDRRWGFNVRTDGRLYEVIVREVSVEDQIISEASGLLK